MPIRGPSRRVSALLAIAVRAGDLGRLSGLGAWSTRRWWASSSAPATPIRGPGSRPAPIADAIAAAPPRRPARPHPTARWRDIEVDLEARTVTRPPGIRIDTGGIGKGLAADLASARLAGYELHVVDAGRRPADRGRAAGGAPGRDRASPRRAAARLPADAQAPSPPAASRPAVAHRPRVRASSPRSLQRRACMDRRDPGDRARGYRAGRRDPVEGCVPLWSREGAQRVLAGRPVARWSSTMAPVELVGPAPRAGRRARSDREGGGVSSSALHRSGAAPLLARQPRGRRGGADPRRALGDARPGDGGPHLEAARASGPPQGLPRGAGAVGTCSRSRPTGCCCWATVTCGQGLQGSRFPFLIVAKPLWTGLGIIGGWLAAILGLSFYVRRWIGTRTWRWMHRWTLLVYVLAVAHTLGSGSDARSPWLAAIVGATAVPIVFLASYRFLPRSRRRPPSSPPKTEPANGRSPSNRAATSDPPVASPAL